MFVAPRSPVRMHWAGRLAIETSLFAAIAAGLWIIGRPDIAIAGFAVWLAHRVVLGAVRVPSPLDYVPPGTRGQR